MSIARHDEIIGYKDARAFALENFVDPLLKRRIKDLTEENERLHKESRGVHYTFAEKENEEQINTIQNFLQKDGRWHPQKAVYFQNAGPTNDYSEVYRFPCCGKCVFTDNPLQFRADGCCASPETEITLDTTVGDLAT